MTLFEKVAGCLPPELAMEEALAPHTSFQSLGVDSLDFIEILNEVEKKFQVRIPNREAMQFRTIGDVSAWLEREECSSPKSTGAR